MIEDTRNMRYLFAELIHNLIAGARLALGLRVSLLSFRISVRALLILVALQLLLDIGIGWIAAGPGSTFSYYGLPTFALGTGVFIVIAAIVSWLLRAPNVALALPVVAYSSTMLLYGAQLGYRLLAQHPARLGATGVWVIWLLITAWFVFVLGRSIAVAMARRYRWAWLRVVACTVLVFGVSFGADTLFGNATWWYAARGPGADYARYSRVVSEEALARQPQILREALDALEPQRKGVVDLYFVGFAPYATQDVFRKDVEMARAVVADRFDGKGRSVLLVNNPRSVLEAPLASVTNLRTTLQAVGKKIDPEEDVVLLFLTSHGSRDHRLSVTFPPLELDELTPTALRKMLDDSGIRWRVIVVSACFSGGFIPALADDHTLVLAAAAADRTSFGCADDSELTYFADALFNQALRHDFSMVKAFARARDLVTQREQAEGLSPPSDPQMSLGAAIPGKLTELEARLRDRAASSASCSQRPC